MDNDADPAFVLFVVSTILLVGTIIFGLISLGYVIGQGNPDSFTKFKVVCQEHGGTVNGTLCVNDNKVVSKYGK